jgi:hypothetical protein
MGDLIERENYFLNPGMVRTPPMIPESIPKSIPPQQAFRNVSIAPHHIGIAILTEQASMKTLHP